MSENNIFDFQNLADLPEGLVKRLSTTAAANPNVGTYSDIVKAAAAAGLTSINISQIEAVAHRMSLPAKSQQAIRTALNTAVAQGLLVKPTRQTYGVIGTPVVTEEARNEAASEAAPVDVSDAKIAVVAPVVRIVPVATPADVAIDPLA